MKLLECDKPLAHIFSLDHVACMYCVRALERMEALLPLAIVMGNFQPTMICVTITLQSVQCLRTHATIPKALHDKVSHPLHLCSAQEIHTPRHYKNTLEDTIDVGRNEAPFTL